jgi:phosphorylase kinase alpha/beta subunit
MLEKLVICNNEGCELIPELYFVPWEFVNAEYHNPHSQRRKHGKKIQSMWSQSLYILSGLLLDNLVNIGEIDPLNRRLSTLPKPETTVQIVLLAENDQLMKELSDNGIRSCTLEEVFTDKQCPVAVLPAKLLGEAYHQLGENSKMNLTGRAKNNVGVLGTGMLYTIRNDIYAFYPSFLDHEAFYLCLDNELLVDLISTDIGYLKSNWRSMGCPLLTLPVLRTMVGEVSGWSSSPMIETLKKIKSGYIAGVRSAMILDISHYKYCLC